MAKVKGMGTNGEFKGRKKGKPRRSKKNSAGVRGSGRKN
jgi:hypothetical protein